MKNPLKVLSLCAVAGAVIFASCSKSDDALPTVTYQQEDQMARPAINTVFVTTADKDAFNQTLPSVGVSTFGSKFKTQLLALNPGYTTNLLTLNADAFTGVLAADVLTASLTGPTTFYDGTNVLTGRALADDVITVELILIFGGPTGASNPASSACSWVIAIISERQMVTLSTYLIIFFKTIKPIPIRAVGPRAAFHF